MGPESSSAAAAASSSTTMSSPGGKRSRDPEDEVYLDNLHSHKRYLSEVCLALLLVFSVLTLFAFKLILQGVLFFKICSFLFHGITRTSNGYTSIVMIHGLWENFAVCTFHK